jgi:hypothetical protein
LKGFTLPEGQIFLELPLLTLEFAILPRAWISFSRGEKSCSSFAVRDLANAESLTIESRLTAPIRTS